MTRKKAWGAVAALFVAGASAVTWTAVLWAGRDHAAPAARRIEPVARDEGDDAPRWQPSIESVPAAVQPHIQGDAPRAGAAASGANGGMEIKDPPRRTIFEGLSGDAVPARAEAYFRADGIDPKWARQTASEVRDKLNKASATLTHAKDASVDSVECRSTACKVTMHFADRDAQREFFAKALFDHAMTMPSVAHVDPREDSVEGVAYLFKDAVPSE